MKLNLLIKTGLMVLVALIALAGCATNMPQKTRRYVWPLPPDAPRIEWVKSYYGENDFPKSGFAVFVETVFGRVRPILFQKPIDIKSNGKGIVYVTDIVLSGIFVFDLPNQKVDFWPKGADPDVGLAISPYFIALDDNGNIYAVGTGRKEIFVLAPSGRLIRRIDFAGKVSSPGGIAVDSKGGRIYLVDAVDSKVAVFSLEGKHLFTFGKGGDADGELNRPGPITIGRKGEVVVGDTMNCRVQIFDHDGKFLRKFGVRGDGPADFQIIKGIATDSDDNIYVTDGKASQLKVYDTNGAFLIAIGTPYSVTQTMMEAPGGFLLPQGIHIDGTDTIYIADQANMRFQQFRYLKDSGVVNQAPDAGVNKR